MVKAKPLKLLAGLQQIGGVLSRSVKVWFVVRKLPHRNLEVQKMLYYIHQTPLSSWRVEGGSGFETRNTTAIRNLK